MISTKDKYAINAMIDIAIHYSRGEYVTTKDIAQRSNLSLKYLEQIIARLVKGHLLISYRGFNGGYGLIKKPEEYTILEIINAISGEIKPPIDDSYNYIKLVNGYIKVVNDYFNGITLADLVTDYLNTLDTGIYYI